MITSKIALWWLITILTGLMFPLVGHSIQSRHEGHYQPIFISEIYLSAGRSQHPSFDPIILSNSNPESAAPNFPAAASSEVSFDPYGAGPNERASWKLKSRVRQIDRRVVGRWFAATPLFEQLPVDPDYRGRSAGIRFGFPSVKLGFALKGRYLRGTWKISWE